MTPHFPITTGYFSGDRDSARVTYIFAFVFAVVWALASPASAAYEPTDTAVLRWLDKVTGRVNTVEAAVGTTIRIGNVAIDVQTCMTRPPEETPESAAFLKIFDLKSGEGRDQVFSGWMFASSPALSAMDHPVYDVWVLDCANRSFSASE